MKIEPRRRDAFDKIWEIKTAALLLAFPLQETKEIKRETAATEFPHKPANLIFYQVSNNQVSAKTLAFFKLEIKKSSWRARVDARPSAVSQNMQSNYWRRRSAPRRANFDNEQKEPAAALRRPAGQYKSRACTRRSDARATNEQGTAMR